MKKFEIDFLDSYDDDSILKELKRIAIVTGKKTVTKADLKKIGNVSYTTIRERFGSLPQALEKAGLETKPHKKPKIYPQYADDESILKELRRMAEVAGKDTLGKDDFQLIGNVSYDTVQKRFGSLRQALEKAGLKIQRFSKSTKAELLHILVELWEQTLEKEGRRPSQTDLMKYGYPVSYPTINRQFGSWRKALRCAFDSVNKETVEVEEIATKVPNSAPQEIVTSKPGRKTLTLRKRFFVLKRDQFTCQLCGKSGIGVRLEVDHKVSVFDGGTDALDNLWTVCFECNRGKSKTSL
jgi:5-methylcytosine-specific restriction endonuclease McrA